MNDHRLPFHAREGDRGAGDRVGAGQPGCRRIDPDSPALGSGGPRLVAIREDDTPEEDSACADEKGDESHEEAPARTHGATLSVPAAGLTSSRVGVRLIERRPQTAAGRPREAPRPWR